jgi:hypothetical protein
MLGIDKMFVNKIEKTDKAIGLATVTKQAPSEKT